mgnify:FL=1
MSRIVVGVAGGIAAYKSCDLIRKLRELGHSVKVVPTPSALKFVGAATFEALSGEPVSSTVWERVDEVAHIEIGRAADLVIIAPATANTIARLAQGAADDLLSATVLVTKAPVIVCPAMHSDMWLNEAVQDNLEMLKQRQFHVIPPAVGRLTGSDSGVGRLPEVTEIIEESLAFLQGSKIFADTRMLITAGGTREPIDPVRFIGNRSSGRQGIAIAKAAALQGAQVTLIACNIENALLANLSSRISVLKVETSKQLKDTVDSEIQAAKIVIMAAAVADFRTKNVAKSKIKKDESNNILELVATTDVLEGILKNRQAHQFIVGFAAETGDSIEIENYAKRKFERKPVDLLVVNDVSEGKVFGSLTNKAFFLCKGSNGFETINFGEMSKDTLAEEILTFIQKRLGLNNGK